MLTSAAMAIAAIASRPSALRGIISAMFASAREARSIRRGSSALANIALMIPLGALGLLAIAAIASPRS